MVVRGRGHSLRRSANISRQEIDASLEDFGNFVDGEERVFTNIRLLISLLAMFLRIATRKSSAPPPGGSPPRERWRYVQPAFGDRRQLL